MSPQPCRECGRRPKSGRRTRCSVCALRHEPIDVQVAASARRLAMVPEELRVKRSKTIEAAAPAGTSWCAGCQSFRDLEDFGKSSTQCRACVSAKTHAARVEKVYGIDAAEYARLLELQGGKCAICGGRPRSKRLSVDHHHQSGDVRGLLNSTCNHDALGALHDDAELAWNAYVYLATPPASLAPGVTWGQHLAASRERRDAAVRPSAASKPRDEVFARPSGADARAVPPAADEPQIPAWMQSRWQQVGSGRDAERGRYLVYIDRKDERDLPPF